MGALNLESSYVQTCVSNMDRGLRVVWFLIRGNEDSWQGVGDRGGEETSLGKDGKGTSGRLLVQHDKQTKYKQTNKTKLKETNRHEI